MASTSWPSCTEFQHGLRCHTIFSGLHCKRLIAGHAVQRTTDLPSSGPLQYGSPETAAVECSGDLQVHTRCRKIDRVKLCTSCSPVLVKPVQLAEKWPNNACGCVICSMP